ncbi:MAG: 2Fe-2S iron-sulfur cluster-binding protein [Pseudomonadota bacterium]
MMRSARIVTGLILFAFATLHLINVAFGLHSIDAMEASFPILMAPFLNPVGGPLLLVSMIVHAALGLESLYRRNTLAMSRADAMQFVTGLLILPFLFSHLVGVMMGPRVFEGYEPEFSNVLHFFWLQNPLDGVRQNLLMVIVWVHGAIGVLTWMRLKPWWARWGTLANVITVLIPVAAMLGYVESGKEIIARSPPYVQPDLPPEILEKMALLSNTKWWLIGVWFAIVALVLIARMVRLSSKSELVTIKTTAGRSFDAQTGTTLLEMAIANGLPHANLCRGRGRCGTCRIKVISSDAPLPEIGEIERKTLDRVGAGENVRLGCQFRPGSGELLIEPLLKPGMEREELVKAAASGAARQHEAGTAAANAGAA